ncbi:MAG: hypothetical protein GY739_12245, partial [Mesoflavibacter sp.]|nr:hypothetical protein [Mesoflavibacter sp.]
WLKQGVIEEAYSPWSSPIFCVKKKAAAGQVALRFVLDFRNLNSLTEKIAAPIPNITDTLERLGNCNYFSTLDMTSAYHSIPMTKEAGKISSFCTKNRQFIFRRLPFGLSNAPSVFCKLMNKIYDINPHLRMFSMSYLDDIIIYSKTVGEHLGHLDSVLTALRKSGLKLNLGKCDLIKDQVVYLGHVVSAHGIEMKRDYIEKIRGWPLPETGKELQSFLGYVNYYQSYFSNFAQVIYPLNRHRNDIKIEWDHTLKQAFTQVKNLFCTALVKTYPDWQGMPFILDTDFSSQAMGGVLSQNQGGVEKMITCFSRACSKHEQNYSSVKGEISALVWACRKLEHMLRYRPFIVRTDNTAVVKYRSWKKGAPPGITIRWILFLQSFEFEIEHRSGKAHQNVDLLTRTNLKHDEIVESDHFEKISRESSLIDNIYNIINNTSNFSGRANLNLLETRLRSSDWALQLDQDIPLAKVRDFLIKNVRPSPTQIRDFPRRIQIVLRHFS